MIYGSSASVLASIRDEASAEVERIEKGAAAEVARLRQEAATTSVAIADRDIRISGPVIRDHHFHPSTLHRYFLIIACLAGNRKYLSKSS